LGNVRSEKVKKIARELVRRYRSRFTADFEENKKTVETLINTPSKRLRNEIAGYVTRLVAISEAEAA
jgi:small subunit ribosomal protein S17e